MDDVESTIACYFGERIAQDYLKPPSFQVWDGGARVVLDSKLQFYISLMAAGGLYVSASGNGVMSSAEIMDITDPGLFNRLAAFYTEFRNSLTGSTCGVSSEDMV